MAAKEVALAVGMAVPKNESQLPASPLSRAMSGTRSVLLSLHVGILTGSLVVSASLLPWLMHFLPALAPGFVAPAVLPFLVTVCLYAPVHVLEESRRWAQEDACARQRLAEEVEASLAEARSSDKRAERAEEKRAADALRLQSAHSELEAFGMVEQRSQRLAASDEASTLAAECAWYASQSASAAVAREGHRSRGQAAQADLPAAQAQVATLEAALAKARTHTQQVEAAHQNSDSSAAALGKEVEALRSHHHVQQEELKGIENELQVLKATAEESRKQRMADTQKALQALSREVTNEERQTRWNSRGKKAAEMSNDALRDALEHQDSTHDLLLQAMEDAEQERGDCERKLAAARAELDALEQVARDSERAEKEAERQRERREQAQHSAEGLKAELQQARIERTDAEQKAEEAQANAIEIEKEADSTVFSARDAQQTQMQQLRDALDAHNGDLARVKQAHATLHETAVKAEVLARKLAASEQEGSQLQFEVQQLLDAQVQADTDFAVETSAEDPHP